MKLESLNSSKFEAFKGNVLTNAIAVSGGYGCQNTYHPGAQLPSDSITDNTNHTHFTDGTSGDLHDTICATGPGEGQLPNPPDDPFTGDYNQIYNAAQVQFHVIW